MLRHIQFSNTFRKHMQGCDLWENVGLERKNEFEEEWEED